MSVKSSPWLPSSPATSGRVETGGRIDMSAEALIDALVRAGSKDRRAWGPVKTFWMRALAVTIHKGVHKVIARPRLPQPRLFLPSNGNSSGNSGPPSAASLARLDAVYSYQFSRPPANK